MKTTVYRIAPETRKTVSCKVASLRSFSSSEGQTIHITTRKTYSSAPIHTGCLRIILLFVCTLVRSGECSIRFGKVGLFGRTEQPELLELALRRAVSDVILFMEDLDVDDTRCFRGDWMVALRPQQVHRLAMRHSNDHCLGPG